MTINDNLFTLADQQQITKAVRQAEQRTVAEIVPVVATCSGRYDRAEDMMGLWLGIIAMILCWTCIPIPITETGNWSGLTHFEYLGLLIVSLVLGFVLGAWLATRVPSLRLLFTPKTQMRDEVALRAQAAFFDRRVHHTKDQAGILIFVSLYERRAVILADQAVLEKVGQSNIDELCELLRADLANRSVTESLCRCIERISDQLAVALPGSPQNQDELANALVVYY